MTSDPTDKRVPAHRDPGNSRPAEDRVATILRDIACPACGYNLRGLPGPIVACPECGERSDIPKMIAARWTGPWYRAPGFNTVVLPTAWMLMMLLFVVFGSALTRGPGAAMFLAVVFLGLLACYGFFHYRAFRLFGSMRGVWMALLGHVVLAAYGVGIIGGTLAVINLLLTVTGLSAGNGADKYTVIAVVLVVLVVCGVAVWAGRRAERYIAAQCIARHLSRLRGEPD